MSRSVQGDHSGQSHRWRGTCVFSTDKEILAEMYDIRYVDDIFCWQKLVT